ncbi:MAG: hypothetical protein PVF65_12190 [Sphingomonadales bacterium]|jgi:rod shape-determining protein MreD
MATLRDAHESGLGIRLIYPPLATLIAMILFHLPTPYYVLTTLAPALPFAFTYYWSVQRPSAASLPAVFIVALFNDLWAESIIGLTAFLALLMRMAIVPNQEVFRVAPFPLRWIAFAVVLCAVMALKWVMISAMHWQVMPFANLVFQFIVTIAVYPLINSFYAIMDRTIIMRNM